MQVISVVFPPSSWFNLHIFCLWFGSFCCSSGDSFWLRLVLSHRRIRNHLSVSSDRLSTYCLTTQNSETQPFVLCHTITHILPTPLSGLATIFSFSNQPRMWCPSPLYSATHSDLSSYFSQPRSLDTTSAHLYRPLVVDLCNDAPLFSALFFPCIRCTLSHRATSIRFVSIALFAIRSFTIP